MAGWLTRIRLAIKDGNSLTFLAFITAFADHVRRPVHGAKMNPGEVFTENAQRKQLYTGKNGDDGSQERKTRHAGPEEEVSADNPDKYANPKKGKYETGHAGQLQGKRTESCDEVKRMVDQFSYRVI